MDFELVHNYSDISSELSDWSVEDDDFSTDEVAFQCFHIEDDSVSSHAGENVSDDRVLVPSTPELGVLARKWFLDNCQASYWKRVSWDETKQQPPNLRFAWETAVREASDLDPYGDAIEMTERQICREVLWLLDGLSQVIICEYRENVNRFVPNDLICVSHLTRGSLCSCLLKVCEAATVLRRLRAFIGRCVECGDAVAATRTYAAFSTAIAHFLNKFLMELADTERTIVMQKETVTLMCVLEKLEPWFVLINELGVIHLAAIDSCDAKWSPFKKCAHLLNVLFEATANFDQLKRFNPSKAKLALCLFFTSVRPYLEILDGWVSRGQLHDPFHEFILSRNNPSLNENFWENCISVRSCDGQTASDVDTTHLFGKSNSLKFLGSLIYQISVIGKSVELLRSVSRADVQKSRSVSLFWSIVHDCCPPGSDTRNSNDDEGDNHMKRSSSFQHADFSALWPFIRCADSSDDIMFQASKHILHRDTFASKHEPTVEQCVDYYLKMENASFGDVFVSSLETNLGYKSSYMCERLFQVLNDNYHLMPCIRALRKYFLFEAGETMHQFCFYVFSKTCRNCLNASEVELNLLLEDVLAVYAPDDISKLSVHVKREDDSDCANVHERLYLRYKVEWPLNIIVSAESQRGLDGAFELLLNIKRAFYQLNRLTLQMNKLIFDGGRSVDGNRQEKIRAALSLRLRLIFIIRSIHDYVHTHVVLDSERVLEEAVGEASDFQRVLDGYRKYIQLIKERSLSTASLTPLRKTLFDITAIVTHFCSCWTEGIDKFSLETMIRIRSNLISSEECLINIIKWMVEKTPNPYLETLADLLK